MLQTTFHLTAIVNAPTSSHAGEIRDPRKPRFQGFDPRFTCLLPQKIVHDPGWLGTPATTELPA